MSTRVAAVQLPFSYFSTPQEFADLIRPPLEQAAEHGAQLIVLPHLAACMLFGMFDFDAQPGEALDDLAARFGLATREWLNERGGYVFEFYLHLFQSLAARTETWLVPGTVLESENDALYLTAFLLNPAGEIVGRQRQMQLTPQEQGWGVAGGETRRVFETEIGDVGIVVGEDGREPETTRQLIAAGATLLLHPSAWNVPSAPDAFAQTVRASAPQASQALQASDAFAQTVHTSNCFGVQANLIGGNFGGGSAIYAPLSLTPDKRGILAQATNDAQGELLLADLDLDALPS